MNPALAGVEAREKLVADIPRRPRRADNCDVVGSNSSLKLTRPGMSDSLKQRWVVHHRFRPDGWPGMAKTSQDCQWPYTHLASEPVVIGRSRYPLDVSQCSQSGGITVTRRRSFTL